MEDTKASKMCFYSREEERKKRKLVGTVLCAIPKYILKTTLNFYSQIIFSANRDLGRDEKEND